MKDEHTADTAVLRAEDKRKKWIARAACSVITYFSLALILLLAIPACLLLGIMGGVWSVADKIIQAIELATE